MIKPEYSKAIDKLRTAYNAFYWLRWFFPGSIAAALTTGLPPVEREEGKSTPYTSAQAGDIIRAFKEASWLPKLLFTCLRAFGASSLLGHYNRSNGDLSVLKRDPTDRISKLPDVVLSHHAPPGMPLTTETPAARVTTDRSNALPAGIGEFLGTRDLAALGATSHRLHNLFKPDLDKVRLEKLLLHVVRGEQKQAETILKLRPDLLTQRGDVTDYSGRTFHNVSPWECMLWALDTRYMGKMMLNCIPAGEAGNAIRRELSAQYDAMQGGGSDLVHIDGDVSPIDIPFNKLGKRFNNEDALLFWNDQFYYAKKSSPPAVLIEPTITDAQRDAFDRLRTSLERMPPNKARKSTPEEHALIAATTHHTLGRKGIHYEQPATYKNLVKIGGNINPGDIGFADLARRFDTNDALLFWNNQFYYANKADSTVTPITPTFSQPATQIAAFDALKTSLTSMPDDTARPPNTLEEHQLINMLFAEHPAFKPTHHCDSHYDFGVIDALRSSANDFGGMDDWQQRDALWMKAAKKQREMPAHVFHHYCDPDRALSPAINFREEFEPPPDFKAAELKRGGRYYYDRSRMWCNLFSGAILDPDFGFQFGLYRWNCFACGRGERCAPAGGSVWSVYNPELAMASDLLALHRLYTVRTDDAKLLQDRLHQLLVPAPVSPTGLGGPS